HCPRDSPRDATDGNASGPDAHGDRSSHCQSLWWLLRTLVAYVSALPGRVPPCPCTNGSSWLRPIPAPARTCPIALWPSGEGMPHSDSNSDVVFWRVPSELTSRQARLLLGKQRAKEIFCSLPELESFVRIQDQRLHECLGL